MSMDNVKYGQCVSCNGVNGTVIEKRSTTAILSNSTRKRCHLDHRKHHGLLDHPRRHGLRTRCCRSVSSPLKPRSIPGAFFYGSFATLAAIRRVMTRCTPGAASTKLCRMERDRNEKQRGSAFGVFFSQRCPPSFWPSTPHQRRYFGDWRGSPVFSASRPFSARSESLSRYFRPTSTCWTKPSFY